MVVREGDRVVGDGEEGVEASEKTVTASEEVPAGLRRLKNFRTGWGPADDNRMSYRRNGEKGKGKGFDAAWEDAARVVAGKNLRGLQVYCPKCHRSGTLTSKWVKKTPVKPVYICHTNGSGYFKACGQYWKRDNGFTRRYDSGIS